MIGSGNCQQIHLESCDCTNTKEEEGAGQLSVPQYHKNKRFSIIVEEELLRSVGKMMHLSEMQTTINHQSMESM